jgi:hypothetical protein
MPEPFSIITGVFGLTTGSINLMLATVEKLVDTSQRFEECKERLRQLQLHIGYLSRKLDAWKQQWTIGDRPFPERTYKYMWGTEGWEYLQTRVRLIVQEVNRMERILLAEQDPMLQTSLRAQEASDQSVWSLAVTRTTTRDLNISDEIISIGTKVAFAVYQNKEVFERLDRVKRLVDDIEADSQLLAADLVRRSGNYPPTYRTDLALWFHAKAEPLWREMDDLFQTFSRDTGSKALLLRPPHVRNVWDSDVEDPLVVEIVCTAGRFATQDRGYWISASYDFHDRQRIDLLSQLQCQLKDISDLYLSYETGVSAVLEETLKVILKNISTLPSDKHRLFCKQSELNRLETAVAVTSWFLYAWPTSWLDRICSCGIRNAMLPDNERFSVFSQVSDHDQSCPGQCFSRTSGEGLAFLGVLLAEIALARPVQVVKDDDSVLLFKIQTTNGSDSPRVERITQGELLSLISSFPLRPFHRAVQYCLDLEHRSDQCPHPLVEHIAAYVENVLDP